MAKILLVEDDTNLSEIYQARMEAEGYTVVAASDGESALAVASKEKPDLVISDVMMPKISGFEMLDILRNTDGLKTVKVIMLTALGQADDRTRAESLGADKYLVKSQVTLEDIVSAAHELLGEGAELPTPAELAMPAIPQPGGSANATDDTTSDSDDATIADPVTTPVQPAPSDPLSATVPAVVPVVESPASAAPVASDPAVPVEVETPVAEAPVEPVITNTTTDDASATAPPTEEPVLSPVAEPQPAMEIPSAPAPEPTPALETALPAPEEPVEPIATPTAEPTTTETTPAEEPTKPAAEPAETAAPTTPPLAQPIDENMVANAIDKLLAKSPANADIAPPTGDTTSTTSGGSSEHRRSRVIEPLSHPETPSLQDLLAKDAAQDASQPVVAASAGSEVGSAPTAAPASTVAPIDPDAALLAKAQAEKAAQATQEQEPASTAFDPRSMTM